MTIEDQLVNVLKYKPRWVQEPYWWIGHLHFAYFIISYLKPRRFVELGTHTGNSYFSFCQSVKDHDIPTICNAVDTWMGDKHAGFYGNEVFERVNYYNKNNFSDFSSLKRKSFDDALNDYEDGSIDLLHIDGHHSYEAVHHDFNSWLRKLAPGAVVLFHDIAYRDKGFGVWQLWDELKKIYTRHCELSYYSGLGVIQVTNCDQSIIPWLNKGSSQNLMVETFFNEYGSLYANYFILNQSENQKKCSSVIIRLLKLINASNFLNNKS
jgi:hypothetical protein